VLEYLNEGSVHHHKLEIEKYILTSQVIANREEYKRGQR
jgi:hypothetical protein